jgi:hypothetical protein
MISQVQLHRHKQTQSLRWHVHLDVAMPSRSFKAMRASYPCNLDTKRSVTGGMSVKR